MFCTYVYQKSMTQEKLAPQFVVHENEHVLDCCAKFAQACVLLWVNPCLVSKQMKLK